MAEEKLENKVTRSLYYYDYHWKRFNVEKGEYQHVKNKEIRLANFLRKFEVKATKKIPKKYIKYTEKEDTFFIITDTITKEFIEFRLILCKLNGLPLVEYNGELEELEEYIDKNQNIAEVTHCVFFIDSGIVGAEFNFSGARLSTLNWYIPRILHVPEADIEINNIKFNPKINGDAYKKIVKNDTISLFEISFKPDSDAYRDILSKKSIFSGPVKEVPDAEVVEVAVKKRKTKRNNRAGMNDVLTREEIKKLINTYREDIKKLYISQGSYMDGVDLLSDKLIKKVDIIRTKRRTISSRDAYDKIKEFYDEEVKPN